MRADRDSSSWERWVWSAARLRYHSDCSINIIGQSVFVRGNLLIRFVKRIDATRNPRSASLLLHPLEKGKCLLEEGDRGGLGLANGLSAHELRLFEFSGAFAEGEALLDLDGLLTAVILNFLRGVLTLDGQDIPRLIRAIVIVLIDRLIFPDPLGCFSSIGVRLLSAHLAYASRACHFHPAAVIMLYQEGLILPIL